MSDADFDGPLTMEAVLKAKALLDEASVPTVDRHILSGELHLEPGGISFVDDISGHLLTQVEAYEYLDKFRDRAALDRARMIDDLVEKLEAAGATGPFVVEVDQSSGKIYVRCAR